mgnify:CR=1 FL=1
MQEAQTTTGLTLEDLNTEKSVAGNIELTHPLLPTVADQINSEFCFYVFAEDKAHRYFTIRTWNKVEADHFGNLLAETGRFTTVGSYDERHTDTQATTY